MPHGEINLTKMATDYARTTSMQPGEERRVVIIDHARVERLREFTDAALAWERAKATAFNSADYAAEHERVVRARAALLPTDTDPLEE